MVEIITSETLYDLLRREKTMPELQPLDKNFYKNILKYLQEKQNLMEGQKNTLFAKESEKISKEIDAIKRMLKEIYERREQKIIQNALFCSRSKIKDDVLPSLPEERKFFKSILEIVDLFRETILESLLLGKMPELKELPKSIKTDESEKSAAENRLIRIIHPIPKFVGTDLNIYGPFEQEDVSLLPSKVADLLIKKNRAEEIKIESP